MTRGERNNNPGNLDYNAEIRYQGEIGLEDDGSSSRFAAFDTPHDGIRALARLLISYYNNHGITSIRGDVSRYAPSSDSNNVDAYCETMERETGYTRNQVLDFTDAGVLAKLVKGHIVAENGGCIYSEQDIANAVQDALNS